MKLSIALSGALITGLVSASPARASDVVYCQYAEYPAGCVARPGAAGAPTHNGLKSSRSSDDPPRGLIVRQDLFDRNNPNNIRPDFPSPPAQPGQF